VREAREEISKTRGDDEPQDESKTA
jgi:hypothetical protein